MGRSDMLTIGLKTLQWLMHSQIAENGYFRPIGSNGFWKRAKHLRDLISNRWRQTPR